MSIVNLTFQALTSDLKKISRVHPLNMANMSAKFDEEAHNGLVSMCSQPYYHICLLWPWPLTSKFNRVHPLSMASMSTKFDEEHKTVKSLSSSQVYFHIPYVNCDLDLWPLTSKINRVRPLTMVNMSAEFYEEAHNSLVSIVFTLTQAYFHICLL